MKTTNKHIYEMYMKGYEDESFGTSTPVGEKEVLISAYELGVSHVLPTREHNVLSEKEVLNILSKK